jgi:LuxR family maltose regulon positive regulatory protein
MSKLTPHEQKVCKVILDNRGRLTNKGIAKQIGVSQNTVKWHLKKVYAKLDVGSKPELVANLCQKSE